MKTAVEILGVVKLDDGINPKWLTSEKALWAMEKYASQFKREFPTELRDKIYDRVQKANKEFERGDYSGGTQIAMHSLLEEVLIVTSIIK